MPDFDANEDPPTLPGQGEPVEPADHGPPVVPRARDVADGHVDPPAAGGSGRLERPVFSRRRRARLRACNRGWRGSALGSAPRRRRLWTQCHGRPPGSPS